jgi:hypothetical protein
MWLSPLLGTAGLSANDMNEIPNLTHNMPAGLQQELVGVETNQIFVVYFLVNMMAPLFLVTPLMVSTVVAADSFASEKERKTMDALLYTPSTDRELFVAKLLSGWLAAIASAAAVYWAPDLRKDRRTGKRQNETGYVINPAMHVPCANQPCGSGLLSAKC